ncbi:MAG: Sec-independent protein translocase TatA [Flavobacterium sp. BFFFF1]|uniref:Sec-independent protein translocase subunit TatA/TatB n=1 Tax=Flavobacterium sp. BFFFF1 TaxID=2015557 RepID=UPI000BD5A10A|nr:twin-arginine translocase TatA/TatE family subunit [Flavobacterium sp. BFFFF1]OYU80473.1 MAG: Sec-independent protein translocase TatA [Flavobacterium sp. BFFFF1]
MFGMGGGEMIFIIFIALMLFGTDKLPEIARGLGKGIAQLKNATNEIKSEIKKSAEDHGFDHKSITGGITEEIDNVKKGFNKMVTDHTPESPINMNDVTSDITAEINKAKEGIDDIAGSVRRQS